MILISLLALIGILTYVGIQHIYTYWKRKGFPYLRPSIPYGNLGLVINRKTSFGINLYELYKQTNEPFVGIYLTFRPALLIRDVKLAKNILSNDFQSFHDRGVYSNPKTDPLSENLFAMEGQRWKEMRAKLSPSFTSGKIKSSLMTGMNDEADKLIENLETITNSTNTIDIKDISAK